MNLELPDILISDLIDIGHVAEATKDVRANTNHEADHPAIEVIKRRNPRNRNGLNLIATNFVSFLIKCEL